MAFDSVRFQRSGGSQDTGRTAAARMRCFGPAAADFIIALGYGKSWRSGHGRWAALLWSGAPASCVGQSQAGGL